MSHLCPRVRLIPLWPIATDNLCATTQDDTKYPFNDGMSEGKDSDVDSHVGVLKITESRLASG
jgi:hypothetical protein